MKNAQTKIESVKEEEVVVDTELESIKTVSGKIRLLTARNMSRSDIAKKLSIRYQHVRNVQLQPLKKVV